jgi:MFS family permease
MTTATDPEAGPMRPRILTRGLLLAFAASFSAMTSFYLLLSVVPLYAASVGADGVGAGLSTGALMAATVAAEFATPHLVARYGHRRLLAAGLILLGAPALALPPATALAPILAISLVRGLGVAITVVVGGALVAMLAPPERRGEALGISGVVVGLPAVLALPAGVWLAGYAGYPTVFVLAAVTGLAGVAAVLFMPDVAPSAAERLGVIAGIRTPALLRPSLVFGATTVAAGVVVTFLPIAVGPSGAALAAVALFAQASAATLSRWWAGRRGDRHGAAGLLVPGLLAAGLGMVTLALTVSTVAVLAGAVVFGVGFGISQNATLSLMFDRVTPSGYGTVSALWNLAYDAGLGIGAVGFGAAAGHTGYPLGFLLTGALVLSTVLLAHRTARH